MKFIEWVKLREDGSHDHNIEQARSASEAAHEATQKTGHRESINLSAQALERSNMGDHGMASLLHRRAKHSLVDAGYRDAAQTHHDASGHHGKLGIEVGYGRQKRTKPI